MNKSLINHQQIINIPVGSSGARGPPTLYKNCSKKALAAARTGVRHGTPVRGALPCGGGLVGPQFPFMPRALLSSSGTGTWSPLPFGLKPYWLETG